MSTGAHPEFGVSRETQTQWRQRSGMGSWSLSPGKECGCALGLQGCRWGAGMQASRGPSVFEEVTLAEVGVD